MKLTIGKKITFGFATVIAIVVCLGAFGFYTSSVSDTGFTSYRGMTIDNLLVGRVQANTLMMRLHGLYFFYKGSDDSVTKFEKRNQDLSKLMKTLHSSILDSERVKLVNNMDEVLVEYRKNFKEVVKIYKDRDVLISRCR